MQLSRCLLLVMVCLSWAHIGAQIGTLPDTPHTFHAQWISGPDAPAHDPAVLRLRKEFTLTNTPEHFVIHVSADNQFLLVVNGKLVGRGPSIGDLPHWRYETYDLAPLLHSGKNLIAATVWNLGDVAPVRQISSHLGFLLDGDSTNEVAVATDSSWLVHQDPGFQFAPNSKGGNLYFFASAGERMDASTMTWKWSDVNAAATEPEWQHALPLGGAVNRGSNGNSWLLMPDSLPTMEYTPTSAGHVVRASDDLASDSQFPADPLEIPAHRHLTLLLDRGTLTTAFPTLIVSGGKGSQITMSYAEALIDNAGNKGNRNEIAGKHLVGVFDEIIPDGAANRSFTPLDWRTWRYLEIEVTTGSEPLKLNSLSATFTAYPFQHRARFESDDPSLTEIWNVGWRTARLCAHDAYMDTPYYERLQYIGDTRIQALISYTNSGDDRLARQAIEAFHDALLPEGITLSRYPSRLPQVITNFSLLWIGMIHDFWYYRNDSQFVSEQLPAIRSVLSYFRMRRDNNGLPVIKDWWPFVDWAIGFDGGNSPEKDGVSASGSLFYLEALQNTAEMEAALGDRNLALEDSAEAQHLRKTIYDRFWSPQEELISDTVEHKHFSQQANALAVWLDVIPKPQQADVITRIYSATDTGFHASRPLPKNISPASSYFRFYLARALVHAGLGDRYLETLGPWHTMLKNGLTTWAEQPEPTRSDSHAWSAHPNIDLLTTVAGIVPSSPLFTHVEIVPGLGSLHHLAVVYPSPRGEIAAEYSVKHSGISAHVTLPAGLSGTLRWKRKTYQLVAGSNMIELPEK
jgi:alpha-L-rhamnosidase